MSASTPPAPNHLFHKVIVVVDDDQEIGTIITELIHQHTSHEVQHHLTGKQALQAIKQFAFASLIPMYFALVGLRLDLSTGFDVVFFVALLLYASAVKSAKRRTRFMVRPPSAQCDPSRTPRQTG